MKRTRVSVIAPTQGRPDAVVRLLGALAQQHLGPSIELEVALAFDGGAPSAAIRRAAGRLACDVHLLALRRVGISEAKNLAVNQTRGDVLLFLNDDVVPAPDLVREHVRAGRACGFRHLVLGRTDWRAFPDDTVMDCLVRSTSMIFFYDQMQPGGLYGFRHAWNLNLSLAREVFEEAGGFRCALRPYMFEDLELAWRLEQKGRQVLYHEPARATHDHRYTWEAYLQREAMLGVMAPVLGQINPACFREIWKAPPAELKKRFRSWLAEDQEDHRRMAEMIASVADQPASGLKPVAQWTPLLHRLHLPLKRRAFRAGFLAGMEHAEGEDWAARPQLATQAFRAGMFPCLERGRPGARNVAVRQGRTS